MGFLGGSGRMRQNSQFNYRPRYYDEEAEERKVRKGEIRLQKGAFFRSKKGGHIVGSFTNKDIAMRDRASKRGQNMRMLLLIAMLALPFFYIMGYDSTGGILTLVGLIILLVVFVKQVNTA